MEFTTVDGKKFTDYNEAKAHEAKIAQAKAKAEEEKKLQQQKDEYMTDVTENMNFCVVDFNMEVMNSPSEKVIFAIVTDNPVSKAEFATLANAYVEECCGRHYIVDTSDGEITECYRKYFPTIKSKDFDTMQELACTSVIDYLINNGYPAKGSTNLEKIDDEYSVMFVNLSNKGVAEEHTCKGCGKCGQAKDTEEDEIPEEVKEVFDFLRHLFG